MYAFDAVVESAPVAETMPMTEKVVPPIVTESPTALLALFAYAASRTTTSLPLSAAVKVRPLDSVTDDSGPTDLPAGSRPMTEKESTENELPPAPSAPPVGGGVVSAWLPPAWRCSRSCWKLGRVPLKLVLVSERTAAAACTLATFLAVVSVDASITVAPRVGSRREVLIWRPLPVSVPAPAPKSKRGPPPCACWVVAFCAVAGCETVMSVPTP